MKLDRPDKIASQKPHLFSTQNCTFCLEKKYLISCRGYFFFENVEKENKKIIIQKRMFKGPIQQNTKAKKKHINNKKYTLRRQTAS